jgi:hypothetical protein
MKWITRKDIKVDRVACPWLIRRFVDPEAQFLFVLENELLDAAAHEGAVPFDAPRIPEIKLNHRGVRCTFEAIIEDYNLSVPGLSHLALIVRAAEDSGRGLSDFSLDELRVFSPLFEAAAVGLQAADLVAARDVPGGTAPNQVANEMAATRKRLDASGDWLLEFGRRLPTLTSVTAA